MIRIEPQAARARRRATWRRTRAWCAGLLLVAGCGRGLETAARPPDVVLIVVDTLRADMVLSPRTETPHVDALAADGIAFSKAFSHAPMTLPAHAGLFSSRLPSETGVVNNWQEVPDDLPLLAEWLREQGFATHAVVSIGTLDPRPERGSSLDRGFDSYDFDYWYLDSAPRALERMQRRLDQLDRRRPQLLFLHFADPHHPYDAHGSASATADLSLDGRPLERVPTSDMTQWRRAIELDAGEHVFEVRSRAPFQLRTLRLGEPDPRISRITWEEGTPRTARRHVRVSFELSAQATLPFELWIYEVLPFEANVGRYQGEVEFVDRYLGRLVEALKARGLYEEALVVFTSDHGESLGEHLVVGHVENLFDPMLRVPLIVKPPAGSPHAARLAAERDRLVPQIDVVPTLLEIAGLPPLPGQRGTSLLAERQPLLLAETHAPESPRTLFCLRDERFKLIYEPAAERFELYDLDADPGELENLFPTGLEARADWPDRLVAFARSPRRDAAPIEADTKERLEALGYLHSD